MRRLRESFEYLTRISNLNNEIINQNKTPQGFALLEAKDTAREKTTKNQIPPAKSFLGLFKPKKNLVKLHPENTENPYDISNYVT